MNHTPNFFDKTFPREIYRQMLETGNSKNLIQTLVDMQTAHGISTEQAQQTAQICLAAVASCEGIREAAYEDSGALLDQFLESANAKTDENRALLLHKLYFGLTAHQDPDLAEKLAQGISTEELFWRYYGAQPPQTPESLTALEAEVRRVLETYDLSPKVIRALIKDMEINGDYLATFAALGEGGSQYKCIVAMELYLSGGMTIHEAANVACAGVETQAVADAVEKGFLTRERAKKILIAAAVAVVVIGVGITLYQAGTAIAAAKTAAVMAEVVNAHSVAELPAVFAQFATATTASGAPALQFAVMGAEAVSDLAMSIRHEALVKQVIGFVTVVLGFGLARISDRTADAIGEFSAVLRKDTSSVRTAMETVAGDSAQAHETRNDQEEETEEAPAVNPEPVTF